jgi:uncharacterized repeat protein (TIGR01451 family)
MRRLVVAASALALASGSIVAGIGINSQVASAQLSSSLQSCSYATSGGPHHTSVCWLNFSGYKDNGSATSIPYTEMLPGGFTLSFTLTRTNSGGTDSNVGPSVSAVTSPTSWPAAAFGRDAYVGISGNPILYSAPYNGEQAPDWTFTLSGLKLTNPNGHKVTTFTMVAADAESTNKGESVSFTTNGSGWATLHPYDGNIDSMVEPLTSAGKSTASEPYLTFKNTCKDGYTGIGTTTVTCTGGSDSLVGDLVLKSVNPTSISTTDTVSVNGDRQGVAFGVITPASLEVLKAEAPGSPNPITAVGQHVTYDITVQNTGKEPVLLKDVTDTLATPGSETLLHSTCPGLSSTTIKLPLIYPGYPANKGAVYTCTATYQVSSAGFAAGAVVDSVTASGVTEPGFGEGGSQISGKRISGMSNQVSIPVQKGTTATPTPITTPATVTTPGLSLTKVEASGSPDPITKAGQTIKYDFDVTNTGNTTLNNLAITDTQSVSGEALTAPVSCPVTSLAAGASVTCTGTYVVTSADIANGKVTDTATATATTTTGTSVTSNPSTLTIPVAVPTSAPSSVTPTTKSSSTPAPVKLITGPPTPPSTTTSDLPLGLAIVGIGLGGLGYVVIERKRHNGHNNEAA